MRERRARGRRAGLGTGRPCCGRREVCARGAPQAPRALVLRPLVLTGPRLRPLERRIRYRVPVRIVRPETERAVDSRLQLFRANALDPGVLVVDIVDVNPAG